MISGTPSNSARRSIQPANTRNGRVIPRLATLLLGLLILFSTGAMSAQVPESPLDETFARLEGRIKRVELENGLRLIMMRNDYAPVVACYMKFKAGSADETDQTSGIAHMLEHMLFKGTRRVGTRDFESEEKYLYVSQRWMNKLDYWRKQLEQARANQDESGEADAQQQVIKWRQRLDALNAMARRFIIQEEDSYLYSVNGARGYNAYTTADLTNYQVNLPANRLEVWARLESDRMQNSVLRDFYTERYVVAEERRMRVENVSRRMLFEQFLNNVYGTHPYGRPVIGPMESIQYLNQGMAMDFYKTYYAPNNAVIAVVGDIQFDETEALIRKYFGPIPARRIPRVARPEVHPPVPHREEVVLEREGTPMLIMGWFKPAMPDPADLHLELLGEILSGGKEARLDQKLVNEQKIAAGVSVYTAYPGQRYTNLFLIQAAPAPGVGMDQLEDSINAEIARVVRDGVTQTELDRVRNRMRADFIFELRDISNLADNLSYYELLTGNYETMFTYYRELDAVTIDDIRNAAREFLPEAHLMSARLVPPRNESSEQ